MATYADIVSGWVSLLEQAPAPYTPPADMAALIPRAIEYAEARIYRRLIFLAYRTQNSVLAFTAGSRTLAIQSISPPILTLEGVAMITPVGSSPSAGTRWQFDESSLDVIDSTWPVEATVAAPGSSEARRWAMKDNQTVVVCPTPDANYKAELTGIFQPAPLSVSNSTTYLTLTYPELFLAAGMVFWAGYERDYGSQSEDPKLGLSWEGQYSTLEAEALSEERRRRGLSPNQPLPGPSSA